MSGAKITIDSELIGRADWFLSYALDMGNSPINLLMTRFQLTAGEAVFILRALGREPRPKD